MLSESTVHQVIDKFHKLFTSDAVDKLARESNFVQRSTNKLNPTAFLLLLVVEMLKNSCLNLTSMVDTIARMPGGVRITAQALALRLQNAYAVRFLKRCYSRVLANRLQGTAEYCEQKGILSRFTNVYIEDSSYSNLHKKTKEMFKGVGGCAGKAGYKIHLIWNLTISNIHSLLVSGGCVTDQSQAGNIVSSLQFGDLVVRDLGYFSIPVFRAIQEKEAYFVSRMKRGVAIYTLDGEPIGNIGKFLDKHLKNTSTAEIEVLIGKVEKLKVRLIAHRVPDNVYNQRMRAARKTATKNGYSVTKLAKAWNRYTIFITNAPESKLYANELATVYRARWEIELIFKGWKSLLHIDIIKGESEQRVQCIILSRLIAVIMLSTLYSHISRIVYETTSRHLSLYKFISYVLNQSILEYVFTSPVSTKEVLDNLEEHITDYCKQKRSRRTTNEYLEESAKYDDLFPNPDQIAPPAKLA